MTRRTPRLILAALALAMTAAACASPSIAPRPLQINDPGQPASPNTFRG
jgi:hypothetical protein